jgi:hypothetical protein
MHAHAPMILNLILALAGLITFGLLTYARIVLNRRVLPAPVVRFRRSRRGLRR